jgi:hypothetical protein
MNRIAVFATVALLVVFTFSLAAEDADVQSGTWKMNPAKSKYNPGPAPKSLTVRIESDANGFKLDSEGVDANGQPFHTHFEAKFDGKDYPAPGLPNGADTVSVKRLNDYTIQSSQKKGGELLVTVTVVVSKDGKTRTSTYEGKDAQGHAVHQVVVYDKE